jgi:glutaredoxin
MLQSNDLLDVVMLKDLNNPSYRNELAQHGANGVPFIKSTGLGTSITGAPPTLDALIKALDKKSMSSGSAPVPGINPEIIKQIKDLDITVYTSDSCHFCVMYKAFLEKAGLRPYVKIVDLTNKEQVVKDPYLVSNELPAIPFTYSKTLKTSFPGLPRSANKSHSDSIHEIITLLTSQSP